MIKAIPYSEYINKPITQNKIIENDVSKFSIKLKSIYNSLHKLYRTINPHQIDKFSKRIKKKMNSNRIVSADEIIGSGSFGTAYRVGDFVIKEPLFEDSFESLYSTCTRTSRILNEINGRNYSRVIKLKGGEEYLLSTYIDGEPAGRLESFDFIKKHKRIIHDFSVDGNVKKDKKGKLYLIDADMVSFSKNKRRLSMGSDDLYNQHPYYLSEDLLVFADFDDKESKTI